MNYIIQRSEHLETEEILYELPCSSLNPISILCRPGNFAFGQPYFDKPIAYLFAAYIIRSVSS